MVMRTRSERCPLSGRQASSPKREATSSAIASIASCAWRPEVVNRMQQPGLAAQQAGKKYINVASQVLTGK